MRILPGPLSFILVGRQTYPEREKTTEIGPLSRIGGPTEPSSFHVTRQIEIWVAARIGARSEHRVSRAKQVASPARSFWVGECGSVADLHKESLVGW